MVCNSSIIAYVQLLISGNTPVLIPRGFVCIQVLSYATKKQSLYHVVTGQMLQLVLEVTVHWAGATPELPLLLTHLVQHHLTDTMRAYIHTAPSRSKGISKIAGSRISGGVRLLQTPPINTNDQTRFVQSCTHGQADNAICKDQCRVQIPYTNIHLEALAYGKNMPSPQGDSLTTEGSECLYLHAAL